MRMAQCLDLVEKGNSMVYKVILTRQIKNLFLLGLLKSMEAKLFRYLIRLKNQKEWKKMKRS
jgi:hypothetical protein